MDSGSSTSGQSYQMLSGISTAKERIKGFFQWCGIITFIVCLLFAMVAGVVALGIATYLKNHRYGSPYRTDMDSANEAAAVSAAIGLLDTHLVMNETVMRLMYIPKSDGSGWERTGSVPDLWETLWNHTYGIRLKATCSGRECPDPMILNVHHLLTGEDMGRILIVDPMDMYECTHCKNDVLYFTGMPQELWPIAPQTIAVPMHDPDIVTTGVGTWSWDMNGGTSKIAPRAWDLLPGPDQYIRVKGRRFGYLLKPLVQGTTYKIQ